jgi:hypothetical protein
MSDSIFGETIYSYSRKQAIEDGVLVDLTQLDPIAQAFKYHMACTDTVWRIIEDANTQSHQDLNGIAHDIATMAHFAIRLSKGGDTVNFKVSIAGRTHAFKLHMGPGDEGEPVVTLMMPKED